MEEEESARAAFTGPRPAAPWRGWREAPRADQDALLRSPGALIRLGAPRHQPDFVRLPVAEYEGFSALSFSHDLL